MSLGPSLRLVAFLALLPALAGAGPAASANRGDGGDRRQEEARLARLKQQRVEDLTRQLADAAGEQRLGVLLQLANLASPRAVEVIAANLDSIRDRPTLLNAVAGTGLREAGPLLLRAARSWGPDAGHPIERLHLVYGPEIAPELRRLGERTTSDAVRQSVRAELIRLDDPRAIAVLRRELADVKLETQEDARRAFDLLSLAADCPAVAADAGVLFRRVAAERSAEHRHLKQYAAGVALWLGDRDSAGAVIDLLQSPRAATFDYPGLHPLEDVLKRQTRQAFATPAEWKAWWTSGGRLRPLFTVHVLPQDEAGILDGIIAWGRDRASGPLLREATVYLEDDSKYRHGREEVWSRLTGDIRVYTGSEITLLEKRPYAVFDIESNGVSAFATLGDGANRMKWGLQRLELAKQNGAWGVIRTAPQAGSE